MRIGTLGLTTLAVLAFLQAAHGQLIYTTHAIGQNLGTIDAGDVTATDVGSFGLMEGDGFIVSAAFDLDGTLYAIQNLPGPDESTAKSRLVTVNTSTGLMTPVVDGPADNPSLVALQVDKNGTILAIGHTNETGLHGGTGLYSINKTTGLANFEGDTEIDRAMDMALRSDGTLWAVGGPIVSETERGNILYQIDPEDGTQLSDISILGTEGVEVMGIMFDASDNLFATGFAENGPLYQLDEETGVATSLGTTFNRPHGGDIFIPEPSSLLLACFGFLGLIRWRKRSG